VVRAMARSDHWRCVSTPRCSRTSRNAISNCPALDEPAQNLHEVTSLIDAQQGLWVEPAKEVAYQHPADWDDGHPTMAPDGGVGADLDGALALAIPTWHCDVLPHRCRIGQHLGYVGQALAFGARPPVRARQPG